MESDKEFLRRQKARIERRIVYSRFVIRTKRPDAKFKALRVLPSQVMALERLNQGVYLNCSCCPRKIERKRLEEVPAAIRCVTCQRDYEKK